jgi:hypothetical protein
MLPPCDRQTFLSTTTNHTNTSKTPADNQRKIPKTEPQTLPGQNGFCINALAVADHAAASFSVDDGDEAPAAPPDLRDRRATGVTILASSSSYHISQGP